MGNSQRKALEHLNKEEGGGVQMAIPLDLVDLNELGAEAEVTNLDDHVLQEDIVELEIAMDHKLFVHKLDTV